MIPVCLNLRNFMSYTDVHAPLRFDGIHVAVLAGDNGHGKSALLDAITWVLWGRSRARAVDDLIHTGAAEMEVEFEFLLGDQQYRVIRKRQRRGKTGLSNLQFAVRGAGGYRAITERSLAETERAIQRTLRMSYETFVSSSFIQQGRADSFTTNQPAERKRILAEILELGYYDELEALAKEAYREREAQLGDERRRAREWAEEVARRPAYQAEVDRLGVELARLERGVQALEGACNMARERVARLEALRRQLEEVEARLGRFVGERERIRATLRERCARLAEAHEVIGRAEVVERATRELEAVRGALARADEQLLAFLPLERARTQALGGLGAERARLEGEVAARLRQISDEAQLAARGKAAAAELREAGAAAAALRRLQEQHAQLQEVAASCREEAAEKRTVNAQLKLEMGDLRSRLDELKTLKTCPVCQRPMEAAHRAQLRQRYVTQGNELKERFRTNEAAYHEQEAAVERHQARLRELAQRLEGLEAAQRRVAAAEGAVEQAAEAERRLASLRREAAEQQRRLAEERFAQEARQQLAEAERALAALAYDEAGHAELRQRAAKLASAEADQRRLDQARVEAEHLGRQVAELRAGLARLEEECAAEQARRDELGCESASLEAERAQLARVTEELRQAKSSRDGVRDQHTQAVARVEACALRERELAESLVRQDALIREQGIFGELAHAFGKKGVQAMIIDTAIPRIEDEANRLLARMTDGRMHVKLETQRDARGGGGPVETLDIRIADELGTRSYETFSGGESFRVNFAIRIALSRLLAQRAGARLQTLVVDEGFGSQDQEGRERLVEAIQAIQGEFEKILVITHLEDLRERFPVRIEVRKTPQGSVYALR